MYLRSGDLERIIEYLNREGEKTARQILDNVQINAWDKSARGISECLANVNEIIRLNCKPYKFKAIPEDKLKRFTNNWKKEKNIIKFELQDTEDTLDYDFNINDFINYDKESKYLNANNLVLCFLEHRPASKLEWIFNYHDYIDNYEIYRINNKTMEQFKICPKGYIKYIIDNDFLINDLSMQNFMERQELKKYLTDRQIDNLENGNNYYKREITNLISKVGTALTKILVNSVKEFDFIDTNDLKELYDYCKALEDYTIDTNRTFTYNLKNKKQLCDLKANEILATKLQVLNFLNNKIIEDYIIKVPQNILDLQNEGQQQNNCVGHYYNNSIKRGENLIYFLRKKDTPNDSCVTCRYNIDNKKTTEHRIKNNRDTTNEQDKIIKAIDKLINEKLGV